MSEPHPDDESPTKQPASQVPTAYPVQMMPYWQPPEKPRRRWGWIVILLLSLFSFGIFVSIAVGVYAAVLGGPSYYQTRQVRLGKSEKIVAVVPIYGVIDSSTSEFVVRLMRELAEDQNVVAVVLRVDTPGGTVPASDQISQAVRDYRQTTGRPVIVSQGGYATSGGYYVSVAGEYIFAEPTTWTGNIGVIMTTFMARKGLEEKLGVQPIVLTSSQTPFKDVPNWFAEMTAEERQYLQSLLDSAYDRFVAVVLQGRPALGNRDKVTELANGKVYTADEAVRLGLVDKVGYIEEAYKHAADRAGVPDATITLYRPRPSGLTDLLFSKSSAAEKLTQDPVQRIQGMLAPQALYLFSDQGLVQSWPTINYSN